MSADKLRKNFGQLVLKAQADGQQPGLSGADQEDVYRKHLADRVRSIETLVTNGDASGARAQIEEAPARFRDELLERFRDLIDAGGTT